MKRVNPAIGAGSANGSKLTLSETRRGEGIGLRIAKQRPEPFLFEMPVVGKNLGQSFFAHRLHRNTIDPAVPLVGAGTIELETGEERFPTLRDYANNRVRQDTRNAFGCPAA